MHLFFFFFYVFNTLHCNEPIQIKYLNDVPIKNTHNIYMLNGYLMIECIYLAKINGY